MFLDFHKYLWYYYPAGVVFQIRLKVLTLVPICYFIFFQSQYFEHTRWVGVMDPRKDKEAETKEWTLLSAM